MCHWENFGTLFFLTEKPFKHDGNGEKGDSRV